MAHVRLLDVNVSQSKELISLYGNHLCFFQSQLDCNLLHDAFLALHKLFLEHGSIVALSTLSFCCQACLSRENESTLRGGHQLLICLYPQNLS